MLRTQVYLTEVQRRELHRVAASEGATLAEVIRQAIDAFLRRGNRRPDVEEALDATFGTLKDLQVPSRSEWDRGL